MKSGLELRMAAVMKSIQEAIPIAEADPERPAYHFRAPAQWMDDPNGIIYYKGYYHIMYSCNPFSATHRAGPEYKVSLPVWGPGNKDWNEGITCWGHARSRDLVHWEHMPIALYPSEEKGEDFCWFGCTAINGENHPIAIYSSCGRYKSPLDSTEQWAAFGDEDLEVWTKFSGNPVISKEVHGGQKIYNWVDPHVFCDHGRTFLVTGGNLNSSGRGDAIVAIYEAKNAALTSWDYRGILFRYPESNLRSIECPNFFKLEDKWVLIVSPHGPVEYFVGSFDAERFCFSPEKHGFVDRSSNLYATNVLFDNLNRTLLWGAIEGFNKSTGWRGCLCLPRDLGLGPRHDLIQQPARELASLRGEHYAMASLELENESAKIQGLLGDTLEIFVEIEPSISGTFGIMLHDIEGRDQILIEHKGSHINAAGVDFPVEFAAKDRSVSMRIFVDRSVMDVFVGGEECITRVIDVGSGKCEVVLFAKGARTKVKTVDVWKLETKDLFVFSYGKLKQDGQFLANQH